MTMKSYFNSKMLLFKKILPKRKTIITDRFIKEFSILKNVSKKKKCHLVDVNLIRAKIDPALNSKFNEFQLKNLSMAIPASKLRWSNLFWCNPWLEASIITLSILFFFNFWSIWWSEIVSGEVKFDLINFFLYLTPKVRWIR